MSQEHIISIEKGFWFKGEDYYNAHIAENAVFVFPGMRLSKDNGVAAADSAPRWDKLEISDEQMVKVTGNVVIFTYHAVAQRKGQDPYAGNITSVYRFDNDEPKMIFHQHTPDPKAGS